MKTNLWKLKPVTNIFKAIILRQKVPLWVVINLTNRCYGRCKYCEIWKEPEQEMSTEGIFSLIDQCTKIGTRAICLTGGDPLLRKDIGRIINYIKSKDLSLQISLDSPLVRERIDILKKVDFLQLSFDGPQEIHDFQRYSGSYNNFIQSMQLAKRENIKFYTLTVLTKYDLDSIDFILNLAKKNRFCALFQPMGATYFLESTHPEFKPAEERYKKALGRLIQFKKRYRYIRNSSSGLKFMNNGDDRFKCSGAKYFAYVHTNGDIYPCWTPPKMKVLNWQRVGFKNAFENIPDFACNYCFDASCIEINYKCALNFEAIKSSILCRILG